jgi:2-octaprenyl-6-methoxyphenol hydroxylase
MVHQADIAVSIAVIGGGPVGLAAALALAEHGHEVALIAPAEARFDAGRTAAVMQPGLDLLGPLLPEGALENIGAELQGIRIIDVTGALLRAPTLTFRASEIGLDRFGLNLPNDKLVAVLREAAFRHEHIHLVDGMLDAIHETSSEIAVMLDTGQTIRAAVAIGADGKQSRLRSIAGIATRDWTYRQTALTFHLHHERDHLDISTEFHTREGPLTFVPLGKGLCSTVWMMRPERAEALLAMPEKEFAAEARRASHALLGGLTLASARGSIPMTGLSAADLAKGRIALVGESAHAFPPIGAQGLNLGLRDVRDLADLLKSGPLSPAELKRYAAKRRADVSLRTAAVDALNRSLLAGFLPFDALRGAGIGAIGAFSPLRRAVMRMGIGGLPAMAQGKRSAGR